MAVKKSRIMYIELKTDCSDKGPARIGRVTFSKTGQLSNTAGDMKDRESIERPKEVDETVDIAGVPAGYNPTDR